MCYIGLAGGAAPSTPHEDAAALRRSRPAADAAVADVGCYGTDACVRPVNGTGIDVRRSRRTRAASARRTRSRSSCSLCSDFVTVGTEQPPQSVEETIAAGFVERVEPSHVGGNVAKVVTLGVLLGRLRIKGRDHPLLRECVALVLVRGFTK